MNSTLERLFVMTPDVWARHTNPLSVWSRFMILVLLAISIWSRAWIGLWCLVPVSVLIFWTWLNPRFFGKPHTTRSWASRAVLGERIWLNQHNIPIPSKHQLAPHLLNVLSSTGLAPFAYGLFHYNIAMTTIGLLLIYLGKLWFLDRMVWLFDDMAECHDEYQQWLY